jgi:hypothetical protein
MKNLLLLLLALPFLIIACSDEPTEPGKEYNYFTFGPSNWFYETVELDTLGNVVPEVLKYDTTINMGTSQFAGKSCNKLGFSGTDKIAVFHYFYAENNKQYYADSKYIQPDLADTGFDFPIDFPEQWVKIADLDASEWKVLDYDVPSFTYDTPVGPATITGKIAIKGKKGSVSTITYKGKSYSAQLFTITYAFTGKASILIFNYDVVFNADVNYWYADGIGLVQRENKPFGVSVPSVLEEKVGGSRSFLMEYLQNTIN